MKVSIQGYEGCFHQLAAWHFFGSDVEVLPCATFGDVVRSVETGDVAAGVMAIENSIAGSIMPNYRLLQKGSLKIVGEVLLHIRQHLMALPGVAIDSVEEVRSHPMALLQCMDFLEREDHRRFRLVEAEDTALSARRLMETGSRNAAAIAGSLAAELFGLEIIAPDIHTVKNNYTRFLILRRADEVRVEEGADKASLYFSVPHEHGSLVSVLRCFDGLGINMTKLQSYPIPSDPFRYLFHVDVEFERMDCFETAMEAVRGVTDRLCVCGVYKRGVFVNE
ncbi:MAG: prephenate dehydratase [Rikenellaceae bacterium]|nr:prephenate dehydratase [Rikenellaceae bacterium]